MNEPSKNHRGLELLKERGFAPSGILDIGAYTGEWSREIRGIFPDAFVLMVEGLSEKEPGLRQVCADIGNADCVIALLGSEDREQASFYVVHAGTNQTGSSRYKENTSCPIEERRVPQRSLNSVLSQRARPQFQLMKIDVQGGELDVLGGSGMYLHRVEAVLMEVSTLQYNHDAPLIAEVLPRMQSMGFVLFDVLDEIRFGDGVLFQFDALFVRPDATFRPQPPFY